MISQNCVRTERQSNVNVDGKEKTNGVWTVERSDSMNSVGGRNAGCRLLHRFTASFHFEFRNGANEIILPRSQVLSSILCHSQVARIIALMPADLSQYTLKKYPEKMNSRIRMIPFNLICHASNIRMHRSLF